MNLELLHSARTESVARDKEYLEPVALQQVSNLGQASRLAHPVHSKEQHGVHLVTCVGFGDIAQQIDRFLWRENPPNRRLKRLAHGGGDRLQRRRLLTNQARRDGVADHGGNVVGNVFRVQLKLQLLQRFFYGLRRQYHVPRVFQYHFGEIVQHAGAVGALVGAGLRSHIAPAAPENPSQRLTHAAEYATFC
ncbi:phosphoserine phosphatase, putative [Babesia ovata]|uniref:Phosphoserine phosphatase, putative n=1 Tax=Babesia ovata TaxID=189622 RepID=A0A2H6K7X6_9APIC|nr:phosphoserine phosphatase, putative [Babesia ovata]GBE59095.1 phosphoserine phosphatase, putative [Babesia ovata]